MVARNWSELRIGDLGDVFTGRTPPTERLSYFGIDFPFITPGDMRQGMYARETQRSLSIEGAELLKRIKLPANSICVSCIGWQMGEVVMTDRPSFTNQQINTIVPSSKVDASFLYYSLSTRKQELLSLGSATGVRTPILNKSAFCDTKVVVPPLPTQQRIAGILSAYDELIENSQRRIKILETMARALYREWFLHFRFPGSENHPRVASALGDIPQGWEVKKLESLMENHIGGGWGKDVADDDHTQPAWVIRGTDIPAARSSQVTGVPHRFHTVSNLRSRKLAVGDILFEVSGGSKGQPVGRTLIITTELLSTLGGDVICASFCKRVRPKADDYGSELLYLSFLEGYESGEIEQYQVQSTGISNFKWTEYIANIERVIPPAPLRSQFRSIVAPLFSQIATVGLAIQNLRRTRDLLLPRLLSGQINVETA